MLDFPRWKILFILLVCAFGLVSAMPNAFGPSYARAVPSWLPSQTINLGLDLQGGAHILLSVDRASIVQQQVEALDDSVREQLRAARDPDGRRIRLTGRARVQGDRVTFTLADPSQLAIIRPLLDEIPQPIGNDPLTGAPGLERTVTISTVDATGEVTLALNPAGIDERVSFAVQQSIEVVRRRIDETGTREPTIQRQGEDRILVQVPGADNAQQIKEIIQTTAKLTFHLVDLNVSPEDIARNRVPPGTKVLPSRDLGGELIAIKTRAMIEGDELVDARATFQENQPVVSIQFNTSGARRFGDVTTQNVGRPFAIVLDDEIVSAPRINEPIRGGSAIISGRFTVQEADNLAVLLRAGALPAKLNVLEERTVGPDLGADSIQAGKLAALLGLAAVIVFIIVSYGWFGVVANVALVVNLALIAGLLSALQATLTLPGIAGIVLTIGMAVDANVLVFERIREEVRLGKTPFAAVDGGYRSALSTIFDANITTLIAAALLFQFGSGPVKGFAVTLGIGIVTSVFTAIMVTRMIISLWLKRTRPKALSI
ncbi:MAG: protein translocase subunit SecD [Pseudomonadota bacterium]